MSHYSSIKTLRLSRAIKFRQVKVNEEESEKLNRMDASRKHREIAYEKEYRESKDICKILKYEEEVIPIRSFPKNYSIRTLKGRD